MAAMDTYTLPPALGDTATVILTGTLRYASAPGDKHGLAVVDLPGGQPVCPPLGVGVRIIRGDPGPTLLQALDWALEHAGEQDPEWVAPETLDWVDQIERLRDCLRGYVPDVD